MDGPRPRITVRYGKAPARGPSDTSRATSSRRGTKIGARNGALLLRVIDVNGSIRSGLRLEGGELAAFERALEEFKKRTTFRR
jgi:hypothetical protein